MLIKQSEQILLKIPICFSFFIFNFYYLFMLKIILIKFTIKIEFSL